MKAFKAYDIRGIWGTELTPAIAYRIGNFIPQVFNVKRILIGRDIRLSSDELFNALTDGITDAGADIFDAGLTTTPMIYWGTGKFDFEFSIMITASHNSSGYNGLKFSGENVEPIAYDNGLSRLEKLVESNNKPVKLVKGAVKKFEMKDDYLDFLKLYKSDYSNLKIAVDCSNGMASIFVKKLMGDKPYYINDSMDGSFPGHEPNPLEPQNRNQIVDCVLENNCDLGVIFDGDADRVMFIDENGSFISPDLIIAVLAYYFFDEKNEKGKVVQDIRTSKSVGDFLKKFDAELIIWKVGRAFGASKLKEVGGIYGGELAGHYYFRDFYYSDSGLLASILVLKIVSKFASKGISFSQIIHKISSYSNTGEINFTIERKQEAMDEVLAYFRKTSRDFKFFDFDGYRLDFPNWWFNIRPSNTEPYLRFLAEAANDQLLEEKTKIIYNILSKYTT